MRIPFGIRWTLILAGLLAVAPVSAQEEQRHGLVWERWVADTFFDGHRANDYTAVWDIPATANRRFGGIPVNPKAAKWGTPVDLGDALRQFDIAEPFWLVIGYWRQEGTDKRWIHAVAVRVEPAVWRRLWGDITRADLERLDAVVKDRTLPHREAARRAQAIKAAAPFASAAVTVNPKIDGRGQRRLQCSLRFSAVFRELAPDAPREPPASPELWGVPLPGPLASAPRGSGR